jgi:hypothetical protein
MEQANMDAFPPAEAPSRTANSLRRFDESFVLRTLRDFFLALVFVIVAELGVRFAAVLVSYHTDEKQHTQAAAEQLAADVKAIMLNRGGPVAARTVYPMFEKSHQKIGLDIAIAPSAATVESIETMFGFVPHGIPATWPQGVFHEARVDIQAEAFCIQCHTAAKPGDVLGTVTVRNYRSTHLAHWAEEVRLSVIFGMANIILHTIVLFMLLRLRMEPLLSLRATIGRLSKAGANLGHRAVVKSSDEFGELANDINHFLDRISHIIADEAKVLGQVGALNKRLSQVRDQMDEHLGSIREPMDRLTRFAFTEPTGGSSHAAMQAVLEGLDALAERAELPAEARLRLHAAREAWNASREDAVAQGEVRIGIAEMHQRLGGFSHFIGEMTALEEKMQAMAEEGQRLLTRLQPPSG